MFVIVYATNFSSMVSIAANCFLCFYRYMVIFNKRTRYLNVFTRSSSMLVLIVVCALFNVPYLFTIRIVPSNDEKPNTYRLVAGAIMKTAFGELLFDVISFVRCFLLMLVFLVINILLLISSVKYARRKSELIAQGRLKKPGQTVQQGSSLENNVEAYSLMPIKTSIDLLDVHRKIPINSSLEIVRSPTPIAQGQQGRQSSSEWNLTKMTLLIALIYLLNLIFLMVSFVFTNIDHEDYTTSVIFDLIAINFVQVTNLFEIISYFLFNRFFRRHFKRLVAKFIRFLLRK